MEAIFTAADISTLATSVSTLLIAIVGIGLLYVGFRHVKRVLGFGK